ncbi:MAG: molybdopterin molybdotransferase MoeA, partial [Vicinamibacterales bacterium]
MRPFASTIPLEQALSVIEATVVAISTREEVALNEADGRVVARTIVAERDVPPFHRALMDGYAVRAEDTVGASPTDPRVLRLVGAQFAGEVGRTTIGPGECSAIATGAPLPAGADAVVMVEHTARREEEESIALLSAVSPGQHIGRQGSDLTSGQVVVQEGTLLNAARLGALASLGLVSVEVFARPRVFVASTGNELVMPGQELPPGHIDEINRFTLAPVIRAHGGDVVFGPTARDTVQSVRDTRRAAQVQGAQLIVLSGGSS